MSNGRPAGPAHAAGSWRAIGTSIRLAVTDPARLEKGRELLTSYLADLDAACSRFRPDSELAYAERAAGQPVQVSEMLADAVAVALDAAEITGGDLDPTVAPAMAALGYDRDFDLVPADGAALPRRARRAQSGRALSRRMRAQPGWRDIRLDIASQRLTLPPGIRLDLGATAKARAADRTADHLAEQLRCGVLVSLGGDLAIRGKPPGGGWLVRIQDITGQPDEPPAGPAQVIAVSAGGLATSGIAARQWRRGHVMLHHILDPRTGMPADPVWRTVSVLAGTALNANIASTAAIIRGEHAPGWLERIGLAARLVAADGTIRTTAAWPREGGVPAEKVPA